MSTETCSLIWGILHENVSIKEERLYIMNIYVFCGCLLLF